MPGSPQKTKLKPPLSNAHKDYKQVIIFTEPPRYRGMVVDILESNKVVHYGSLPYKGQQRQIIHNLTQKSGKCKVFAAPGTFEIRPYSGNDVSEGLIEV